MQIDLNGSAGCRVAGRGICMMSTVWRDKQDHHLINFIGAFLAANSYRLNFLSISPVSISSFPANHESRMILCCLCKNWWSRCVYRTSSSTMGGYQLLSSLRRAGIVGMELLFLAGVTLFPAMLYSSMLLWLFTVTIVMVASVLERFLLQGECIEETVQKSLCRCRCSHGGANRIV